MEPVVAYRRGKNFAGDCPYPHKPGLPTGKNMVISISRGVYHCFACGLGGFVPDRAYLAELAPCEDQLEAILVALPSFEDAKAYMASITMQGLMRAKRQLPHVLPPNILPFWEMGQVVEMSPEMWRVQFPAKAAIAKERIALCKDVIEKHIADWCISTPKLVIV